MKYTVSKRFNFEAAHSLPFLPIGHKCRNLHGHSYAVVVACMRCKLDKNGFVIDYADISKAVDPLIAKLDHQNLNEILPFKTTAEEIAQWFYEKLDRTRNFPLAWVEVYETPKTCVRVEPLP